MSRIINPPAELRYAVLRHDGIPDPHFDLLIETSPGSPLATWRCPVWPITERTQLTRLKDHRLLYLDFEGQLTGNRGSVHRIEAGICQLDIGPDAQWTLQLVHRRLTLAALNSTDWLAELSTPAITDRRSE